METKEIILPDGWEVKEVKGNKIIIGDAEMKGLRRRIMNASTDFANISQLQPIRQRNTEQ